MLIAKLVATESVRACACVRVCVCVDTSKGESITAERKNNKEVFTCPVWTNFKLDIDAVMNAMFPASTTVR